MKKLRHREAGSGQDFTDSKWWNQDESSCRVAPKAMCLESSPFGISRLRIKLNLVSFLGMDIRGPEGGAGGRSEAAVRLGPHA